MCNATYEEIYTTHHPYKKEEGSQISDLKFYLKKLEKEDQLKWKVNRRKEIIKITVEINEIENQNW